MSNHTFGSVCSGIEASQLAFSPFGFNQLWSSEIAEFPSKVLQYHYPTILNVGDMIDLPEQIIKGNIIAPDLFCGGTPCQAFSLAGWKNGLTDERGMLTMTFIKIADAIDTKREAEKKKSSVILWENVEGVLHDKTNAFGNFIAGLAGFDEEIIVKKWHKSGYLEGPKRNVAWRVLDAKYFGLPQQRKRLYVLAGGKDFMPDQILFEFGNKNVINTIKVSHQIKNKEKNSSFNLFSQNTNEEIEEDAKVFFKFKNKYQIFRDYTDCLYSAYGTKWNGNAAAYNGSLYVAQNDRIRRFTPLECERLMGIPDNYTKVNGNSDTNRYQAVGNSWAVPVVKWIGERINEYSLNDNNKIVDWQKSIHQTSNNAEAKLFLLGNIYPINQSLKLNSSSVPNTPVEGNIYNIIQEEEVPEKFYLSPQACLGILRRKMERNVKMNKQLEKLMTLISQQSK